jgi:hypothetical protein
LTCRAAHPGRSARLAQPIDRGAARHLSFRTIAEPSAGDHEIFALRLRLKSEHAGGRSACLAIHRATASHIFDHQPDQAMASR